MLGCTRRTIRRHNATDNHAMTATGMSQPVGLENVTAPAPDGRPSSRPALFVSASSASVSVLGDEALEPMPRSRASPPRPQREPHRVRTRRRLSDTRACVSRSARRSSSEGQSLRRLVTDARKSSESCNASLAVIRRFCSTQKRCFIAATLCQSRRANAIKSSRRMGSRIPDDPLVSPVMSRSAGSSSFPRARHRCL